MRRAAWCYNVGMVDSSQPSAASTDSLPEISPAPRETIPLVLVGVSPALDVSWQTVISSRPPFEFAGAAATGAEALERLTALAPRNGIVVVDFQLTIVTAVALLAELKEHWPQLHRLAIVATAKQRAAAVEAGAEVVLFKGFHMAELSVALDCFTAEIRERRQDSAPAVPAETKAEQR